MTVTATTDRVPGLDMFYLGFGTYLIPEEQVEAAVTTALEVGYRHIDTAEFYNNEAGIGRALAKFQGDRSELYITSKVFGGQPDWGIPEKDAAAVTATVLASLEKLQLEYIDLYLIHAPSSKLRLEQYRALLELQKQGKVKHVGVANYSVKHLEEIRNAEDKLPMPEANQMEIHPLCRQSKTLKYMKEHGIQPIAYSSLAPLSTWRQNESHGGQVTSHHRLQHSGTLSKLAQKYEVSEAQLLLRWALDHGYPIIPKSTQKERMEQNRNIFGFVIAPEDLDALDKLDTRQPSAWAATSGLGFDPLTFE